MCYVPPSVELLGPMTPSSQIWIHDPQISNQIDASGVITVHILIIFSDVSCDAIVNCDLTCVVLCVTL